MNRKEYKNDHYGLYFGDPRYEKVWEQMKLLGIQDVTTMRQHKNGTIVWRLPIRNSWRNGKFIEVGSFKSGMVRNQNSAYSNYQLNKCKAEVRYYKDYKTTWNDNNSDYTQEWTGKYNKYVGKQRILIPIEIDRLEYLISYCLKNYYIKHANFVANGDYVTKWRHEWELKQATTELAEERNILNDRLDARISGRDCGHYETIRDLENKLATIKRIADYE